MPKYWVTPHQRGKGILTLTLEHLYPLHRRTSVERKIFHAGSRLRLKTYGEETFHVIG